MHGADGSWFWHPDTAGLLPQSQVDRLKEIGALYSKTSIPPVPSAPNFIGTWKKNVYGDSIVTQTDSCFRYNSGKGTWHACNGLAPYYDECPAPITLKISIYNNIWTAQISNLSDDQEIFTYLLKKQ